MIPKAELQEMRNKNITTREIAEHYGCHMSLVNYYIKKYKLPLRIEVPWRKLPLTEKRKRQKESEKRKEIRMKVLNKLGGKCVKCDFSDWRALQIDHIKGGGHEKSNTATYYEILKMSETEARQKYQCLCANCNWIKRCDNKETRKK